VSRADAWFEATAVIGFKNSQAGVEQFPFRYDDDVEAARDLVSTENLSYQTFSSVPLDRPAELPRGGDSQAADLERIRQHEQRRVPASDAHAVLVNVLELGAPADSLVLSEPHHRHGRAAAIRC
jgi:hypothetical protein